MRILGVFLSLIIIISCQSSEKTGQTLNASPNDTVIEGVLISEEDEKVTWEHPCQEQNCFAKVRVSKIVQRGNNLASAFKEGDEIRVFFAFGMKASGPENFKELKDPLPGLSLNDSFKATLEIATASSEEKRYTIYRYKKLN
ncbi:hypothetical protein KFE98_14315 [bacterium SCSIO 12741]|nr:hypothetical protein KFE98_14315 [bacterium SCSIO 12741]